MTYLDGLRLATMIFLALSISMDDGKFKPWKGAIFLAVWVVVVQVFHTLTITGGT